MRHDINQKIMMKKATVIYIDVNNFTRYNILYGEEIGDDIISKVDVTLNLICSFKNLIVKNITGDKFVIMDENFLALEEIESIIENIHHKINKIKHDSIGKLIVEITVGIAYQESNALLKSEIALKHAKKHGLYAVVYNHNKSLFNDNELILHWQNKIANAVEKDYITPFYQPIVNSKGELVKYEALMRIKDGDRYISPVEFLSIAKETRQYCCISKKMFEKTFLEMSTINIPFSINVSISDMKN